MQMKSPKNTPSINIGGVEFTANKKGLVNIPEDLVEIAKANGFTEVTEAQEITTPEASAS